MFGALAAHHLKALLGYLVVISVGMLLTGVALGSVAGLAASFFYLVHSTWIAGACSCWRISSPSSAGRRAIPSTAVRNWLTHDCSVACSFSVRYPSPACRPSPAFSAR